MGERSRRLEIPLEIVYDILLRLPVKTLGRSLCVSKQWYSLISRTPFKKEYNLLRSQQNPLLLVTQNENDDNGIVTRLIFSTYDNEGILLNKFSKTVFAEPFRCFEPIQSCLGLICLGFDLEPIHICNPSTEELVAVPNPTKVGEFLECIGFGYAKSTEEFKVIRFFRREAYHEYICCEVFTLGGTGSWRKARNPPPYQPRWDAPLLHGSVHLMPSEDYEIQEVPYLSAFDINYEYCKTKIPYCIAAFDIDSEEYTEIPLPEIYFSEAVRLGHLRCLQLAEFRGSLCLTFDCEPTKILELWFLKDYNNGKWAKQYNIDLSSTYGDVTASPSAIMDDESILTYVYLENDPGCRLLCYNTKANCFTKKIATNCSATTYVESFFPLGNRREISTRGRYMSSKMRRRVCAMLPRGGI